MWGKHLILDVKECDIGAVTNRNTLNAWVTTLVDRIGMKAYGQPQIEHFAAHDPETAGFTLIQLIETSAITGHFVDKNGDAYIDIFSCKEFDTKLVVTTVEEFFCPISIKTICIDRDA